jgi:hypothetical protein
VPFRRRGRTKPNGAPPNACTTALIKMKSTLQFVLNESEAIRHVLPRIPTGLVDFTGLKHRVLREKERVYGRGMIDSMGDIVIEFRGDGNWKVDTIRTFVDKVRQGYNLVIASRYMSGARGYDYTAVTRSIAARSRDSSTCHSPRSTRTR